MTAKQEIQNFIESGDEGMESQFTRQTLEKAAEQLFSSKGLYCPVSFMSHNKKVFLVNRKVLAASNNT